MFVLINYCVIFFWEDGWRESVCRSGGYNIKELNFLFFMGGSRRIMFKSGVLEIVIEMYCLEYGGRRRKRELILRRVFFFGK